MRQARLRVVGLAESPIGAPVLPKQQDKTRASLALTAQAGGFQGGGAEKEWCYCFFRNLELVARSSEPPPGA